MAKKKSDLQIAQENAQKAIDKVNQEISVLGEYAGVLYTEIGFVQEMIDNIRYIPSDNHLEFERLKKIRSNWKSQAEKIEKDYKEAYAKSAGAGAAGASLGAAIVALGPTAAMGVATTFGVASTGTAIAALHGAVATKAALAWLGGGALVAGGGGVAVGQALLALAGPVGWAIAGVALISSGIAIVVNRNNQKELDKIFTLISERDVKSYNLAIVELNERIEAIKNESKLLHKAIARIQSFGVDYSKMNRNQQYELGSYVNLVLSSTQLLTNPILGLQPKYTENDFIKFCDSDLVKSQIAHKSDFYNTNKDLIIMLCNLLYKIDLDEKENKLLWDTFRNNKQFLKSVGKNKKGFPYSIFETVQLALSQQKWQCQDKCVSN